MYGVIPFDTDEIENFPQMKVFFTYFGKVNTNQLFS